MNKYILKASGEKEFFDIDKFRRSLKRSGAADSLIDTLVHDIKKTPALESTKDIYRYALAQLKKAQPTVAARYNIKDALRQFGPSGYPFENFVAEIFKAQGFKTKNDIIIQGKCVSHEVDVVVAAKDKHFMVECKFHNLHGPKTDVVVTLYIKARFDDIHAAWLKKEQMSEMHQAWIVTNTKFTSQAIAYAECEKINLLGWNYPYEKSLAQLIDQLGIHPITALTCLNAREKKYFIQHGLVLCRDVQNFQHLFKQMHIEDRKIKRILEESRGVCQLEA